MPDDLKVFRLAASPSTKGCIKSPKSDSLADAKDKIAVWLKDYNESRPHRALNNLAPLEYVAQLENGA